MNCTWGFRERGPVDIYASDHVLFPNRYVLFVHSSGVERKNSCADARRSTHFHFISAEQCLIIRWAEPGRSWHDFFSLLLLQTHLWALDISSSVARREPTEATNQHRGFPKNPPKALISYNCGVLFSKILLKLDLLKLFFLVIQTTTWLISF